MRWSKTIQTVDVHCRVDSVCVSTGRIVDIPLPATGTVFVNLPAVGRLGVCWGPFSTTWQIR